MVAFGSVCALKRSRFDPSQPPVAKLKQQHKHTHKQRCSRHAQTRSGSAWEQQQMQSGRERLVPAAAARGQNGNRPHPPFHSSLLLLPQPRPSESQKQRSEEPAASATLFSPPAVSAPLSLCSCPPTAPSAGEKSGRPFLCALLRYSRLEVRDPPSQLSAAIPLFFTQFHLTSPASKPPGTSALPPPSPVHQA